jgi:hypothetical protein
MSSERGRQENPVGATSGGRPRRVGPPAVEVIRQMLAAKRDDGCGCDRALMFTLRADHSGVVIPAKLRDANRRNVLLALQHQFWDLEDSDDHFGVTLAFDGEKERVICPYDALVDFYEWYDAGVPEDAATAFVVRIPAEAEAIRRALAVKAEAGPTDRLAIQIGGRLDGAVVDPCSSAAPADTSFEVVLSQNYWDLDVRDDDFRVTLFGDDARRRIVVPYESVEEIFGFSLRRDNDLCLLGERVEEIDNTGDESTPEEQPSRSVLALITSWKPSLALSLLLLSLLFCVGATVLIALAAREHRVPVTHIVFFSYLTTDLLSALKTGHVPMSAVLSDASLLGGLGALWASALAVTGIALILPMKDDRPMHMQASIAGFFYAYVAMLLVYGGITLSARYVPGMLRVLWIVILFALSERAKRACSPSRASTEYVRAMADGLFAIGASFIIAQGIDKTYDEALSGPVFVLVYFGIMLLFGRRIARRLMLRQLTKSLASTAEIEVPEQEGPVWRRAARTAKAVAAGLGRERDRLILLPFDELVAEYKRRFGGEGKRLMANSRLRDAAPSLVGLLFVVMMVWSAGVLFALWGAANVTLHIIGVGR